MKVSVFWKDLNICQIPIATYVVFFHPLSNSFMYYFEKQDYMYCK